MSAGLQSRAVALGLLLAAGIALSGCASTVAELPAVGTPADAPPPSKEASGYLPVHDMPPDREAAVIPPNERAKIEAELIKARDRQAVKDNPQNANASAKRSD
ncbi:hypothetical protein [Bradyrhizobium sp. NP1]|jgi:hypothetical protein|uniref:hypothetical protein n=1 Tax=Bradyrhizobium sp. NP1 TaxID=3049772 RepID=UPI0025A4CCF6|nr:hypothetical protein [Bradyrhizobium sp. NP1]WJR75110.1 hypothetical protein QOU61_20065 [Bradyrhizobium sp. NP1]